MSSKEEQLVFEFPCGCKFKQDGEGIKPYDGLPSISIDYYNIPLDCPHIWELAASGRTRGIFQLKSNLGRGYSKKLEPTNIDHISALAAILRPGCLNSSMPDESGKLSSMTNHYIERKNGNEAVTYIDSRVEKYLKETYGIMIYQEQALAIARDLAGFNPIEAYNLQKCVTGDTRFVSKTRGWISINTLIKEGYKNDEFLIMNEYGEQQWKKISEIWSTGKKSVTHVRCDSGLSVKATKYHQFLTDTGWKARLRLTEEDRIISVSEVEWEGQDRISCEMAIIIAGLITEGYFVKDNSATFVNYDEHMLSYFEKAFCKEFGEMPKRSPCNTVIYVHKEFKDKIAKYMSYGLSGDKHIPEIMMGMTKESTRKFLAFMLNAEGCVTTEQGRFEYSSKSKECIEQVHLLLLRFGISSYYLTSWNEEYQSNYYKLFINDNVEQKKLLKEFGNLLLDRKKDLLISHLKTKNSKNYTSHTVPQSIVSKIINQYPRLTFKEGCSIYKDSIGRRRFNIICNKSKDKEWIKLSQGRHRYATIKSLNEVEPQKETFDFSIEDENTPYIIANGMIIHNCISKKLADKMAALKDKFIEGCIKNGISSEITHKIFDNIESSNRYSFCKGHSYSYGYMSVWTLYAKAHFPLHFFCAAMKFPKDTSNGVDELGDLLSEASLFNIPLKTPSIDHLFSRFTIQDGAIHFGLAEVKGIGKGIAEELIEEIVELEKVLNKPAKDFTWYEFLTLIAPKTTSTVVYNLISCGFLDHCGITRTRQLAEYKAFLDLTGKPEIDFIERRGKEFNSLDDLIKGMLEEHTFVVVKKETVKKETITKRRGKVSSIWASLNNPSASWNDTTKWICDVESELLGTAISASKTAKLEWMGNLKCLDFSIGRGYNNIRIVCEVVGLEERVIKTGKNAGKTFANIKLKDTSGEIECTIFSAEWSGFRGDIVLGNVLLLSGKRNQDKTLRVEEVKVL